VVNYHGVTPALHLTHDLGMALDFALQDFWSLYAVTRADNIPATALGRTCWS